MADAAQGPSSTARGMYHLFLGNVVSTVLSAISIIVVARLLGSSGYGLYAIALITPTYAQTLIQLGIPSAATRYAAKFRGEGSEERAVSFVYSMAVFQLLLAVAVVALVVPFSFPIASSILSRPDASYLVPIAVLSVVGQALYLVTTSGLQGMNRMKGSASLQVVQAGVKAASMLSLVLAGFAVFGAVAGFTISFLVAGMAGFLLIIRMRGRLIPSGWGADLREAVRYSLPIYAAALASGLVSPYQVTLLARFVGDADIGFYTAALNIATLMALFTYPIVTTLFPLFSSASRDERGLGELFDRVVRYFSVFMVPVSLVVIALSSPLAAAVYGKAFGLPGGYVALVAAQYLLVGLGGLSQGALLNGIGETRKSLIASLASSIAVVTTATLLIPFLYVYGSILATLAGACVGTGVSWMLITRRMGSNVRLSGIWRIYLASGIAAALVYPISFIPLHPIIVTLLGGAAFLLLVIPLMALTGAVGRKDMEALEGYFRSVGPVSMLFRVALRYYDVFSRR